MIAIFDIETNGLYQQATKIHCIAIKIDDEPTRLYTDIPEALAILGDADVLVAHNGINFDIPAIQKLYPEWDYKDTLDTYIMSQLAFPTLREKDMFRKSVPSNLKGSHSLKAWGYRLRKLKGEYGETADWKEYTEAMGNYCKQDVEVTFALYNKLLEHDIPKEAIWLEQEFAKIISRQEKYGVYFDVDKAKQLHIELMKEVEEAEQELYKVFKPLKTWTPKPYPKIPAKKDGTKSTVLLNQELLGCHFNAKGEWGYFKTVEFNPSSRQHIARWLKEVYKWKPTDFTEKGTPKIDETVLEALDFPEGKLLAHYFNVTKLIGQLAEGKNAWLSAVDSNNRIHGRVSTLGAVSRRCTHSNPNMAQVPSNRAYKGHEARSLFTVPKGKKLVGCDADALELRTLSHFMYRFDAGKYAEAVDKGEKDKGTDIHTLNQKSAGLKTRDEAKTFIYAFLYGAGDAKIGSIVGGSEVEGKSLKARFFRKIPAIKDLVDLVAERYKKNGHLTALDKNPYHIRAAHSALNTLLQGAGALVMKYWLVFADRELQKKYKTGKNYEWVLNVHDEGQLECDESIAEDVAQILEGAFAEVTSYLDFKIPIRGTAAIGNTWAETH